jgi:hypothetical protein
MFTLQQRYILYLSCSVFLFPSFLFFHFVPDPTQLLERTLKAASGVQGRQDSTLVAVLWHAIHPLHTPCEQNGVVQQSNFYGLWLASNQIIRRFSLRDKLSFHSDSNENVFVRSWWYGKFNLLTQIKYIANAIACSWVILQKT